MAKLEYRRVSATEVESELATLDGWAVVNEKLEKSFSFGQYQEGLVFSAAVGYLADRLNHHPDMAIGYKKVIVSLTTHDTGGLSPYDFELARRIDAIT